MPASGHYVKEQGGNRGYPLGPPSTRPAALAGREKDGHRWQQAEAEASHFIEHLCPAGGLVVDPFAGSGITLAAAKRLDRQWIGIELDEKAAQMARARVASIESRKGDNGRPARPG